MKIIIPFEKNNCPLAFSIGDELFHILNYDIVEDGLQLTEPIDKKNDCIRQCKEKFPLKIKTHSL